MPKSRRVRKEANGIKNIRRIKHRSAVNNVVNRPKTPQERLRPRDAQSWIELVTKGRDVGKYGHSTYSVPIGYSVDFNEDRQPMFTRRDTLSAAVDLSMRLESVHSITDEAVHGFIYGRAGIGKTYLTYHIVLGLALKARPEELNFVFLGHGAFKDLAALPHCLTVIDHLNHEEDTVDNAQKLSRAITTEIDRRLELLDSTRSRNFNSHNASLLGQVGGLQKRIVPTVFVLDEAMIWVMFFPEFRAAVERLAEYGARVGMPMIFKMFSRDFVEDSVRKNGNVPFVVDFPHGGRRPHMVSLFTWEHEGMFVYTPPFGSGGMHMPVIGHSGREDWKRVIEGLSKVPMCFDNNKPLRDALA